MSSEQQQKLAALGMISAGIAHEIQNPLNFVINFSKMSEKLLCDLKDVVTDIQETISSDDAAELNDIADSLDVNIKKIQEHGARAVSIIQGILLISRGKEGELLPTDIPHLLHEYVWLSFHAKRADDRTFNVTISESYPDDMPKLMVIPQDLSRAIINVMNNACYAVNEKRLTAHDDYQPAIDVHATLDGENLLISISDNGVGIPVEVQQKLFSECVTTKPVGKGTGLGMQIVNDIITGRHRGSVKVQSEEGVGTTITLIIPARYA